MRASAELGLAEGLQLQTNKQPALKLEGSTSEGGMGLAVVVPSPGLASNKTPYLVNKKNRGSFGSFGRILGKGSINVGTI